MFDASNDLAAIADGAETVTLLRRGSESGDTGSVIAHALRRAMTAGEAAIVNRGDIHKQVASGGQHMAVDLVWHLPMAELTDAPALGDWILDSAGHRWTILEVKRTTLSGRWRCAARNVAIAYRLDDTISVLKRSEFGSCGPSEPVWRTWRTGIRARVQPIDSKIVSTADVPYTVHRYRVFVEEELVLDHTCCLRGPDGILYNVTAAIGADRIGELQVLEAERMQ